MPNGNLLASTNSQDPAETVRVMRQALSREKNQDWEKIRAAEVPVEKTSIEKSAEYIRFDLYLRQFYPRALSDAPGSMVPEETFANRRLMGYAKDKPESYWLVESNRDTLWISHSEFSTLVPDLPEGSKFDVSPHLSKRIAQFSLVDTIRAISDPYKNEAIKSAVWSGEVVSTEGHRKIYRYTGHFKMSESGLRRLATSPGEKSAPVTRHSTRTFDGKLHGTAIYDQETKKLVKFDIAVMGSKKGGLTFSPFETTQLGLAIGLPKPGIVSSTPRFLDRYEWMPE
jgi:hypothetical protein